MEKVRTYGGRGRPQKFGQIRPVVLQAKVPTVLKSETADYLRGLIGQFLRDSLTPELASERRRKLGASLVKFSISHDDIPYILRSLRISAAMDSDLSEYAGIMQLKKRDVAFHAMLLGASGLPVASSIDGDFIITRRGERSRDLWSDRGMLSTKRG